MIDLSNVTLAVLAGGAGRRMGGPKAWLTIDGKPIVSRLHRQLDWPGPTLLISSPGREHPPGSALFTREVCDPVADEGPLRGIATALAAAETALVVVVPVDMPNMTRATLEHLVEAITADRLMAGVYFDVNRVAKPLPVVIRKSLRSVVDDELNKGDRALWRFFKQRHFVALQTSDSDVWINVNHTSDLSKLAPLPPLPRTRGRRLG